MGKANDERRVRMVRAVKDAERALKALEESVKTRGEGAVPALRLQGARRRLGARRSALSRYENSKRSGGG